MATEVGDELVSCTICFEHFTSPKTLQCLHTFCECCLQRHLAAYLSQRQDLIHPVSIPCPTCRELTPLPEDGISGLRTDFKIAKITEFLNQVSCKNTVCNVCRTVKRDSPAAYYCRDCNKHFCEECIYRHKNTEVFDAHVVKELGSEKNSKAVCSEHEEEMESIRYFCQSCEKSICTLCAMTEHMLHNLTDLDTGKARHERTKKIRILVEKVNLKVNQIDTFMDKLQSFEENLKSSYTTTEQKITLRATEIVTRIHQQEKELKENLQQQYEGKLQNICNERENLKQCRHRLTKICDSSEKALEEDNSEPFFDVSNEVIRELKNVTQIQFLNPDDFTAVKANFELTFPKEMPHLGHLGERNLSANLQFMSRIPIQLVTKITTGSFDWPTDADIMPDGSVIIADTENYQLKIFDQKGQLRRSLAIGEIKPAGVAVTRVRTIAVTDILERCVKIFSEHGQLLFEFGHNLFDSPAGIAVNKLGQYIISDIGNHCVSIHDSQGNILARLGSYGNEDCMFDGPWYVATNDQNDLIISDMGNHCVKIFDCHLNFISRIEDPDDLLCPSGVGVDLQGNILISDSGRSLISMYTPDGQLIDHILTEDDGINSPHGLYVADSGQLVITQCGNRATSHHEVRIYQLYD